MALRCGRYSLVDAIAMFLARDHAFGMTGIRASLEQAIDAAGPAAIDGLARRLADAGSDWSAIGRPVPVSRLDERANGDRQLSVDAIGTAIVGLLPVDTAASTVTSWRPIHVPARCHGSCSADLPPGCHW